MSNRMGEQLKTSWLSGFLAILYYEFLWNIRKKKIVGLFILAFVLVTLSLALTPILDYFRGITFSPDSNAVSDFFNTTRLVLSIFIFLIAVATAMNTISGEFETGTITPLLTKPVSKNTIFLGKIVATVLTLLAIYAFLTAYVIVGALIIDGSQNDLVLAPLGLAGLTLATMVWASVVLVLGTLSKNSLMAALGSFGVFIVLMIAGAVLGTVYGQTAVLFYAPGSGAIGTTGNCPATSSEAIPGTLFATGTDNLGYLLIQLFKIPNDVLNFCGVRLVGGKAMGQLLLSSDLLSTAAFRALGVSAAYIAVLLLISWFAFRRSQIIESA
jgi:ABC-type transport system involved in multi-copper enzyme maturation permease subunit